MKRILLVLFVLFAGVVNAQEFKEDTVVTGIEEDYELVDFKIYPNPTLDKFTIEVDEDQEFEIFIYSTNGVLVLRKRLLIYRNSINISTFRKGLYFITLYSADKSKANIGRIVKL